MTILLRPFSNPAMTGAVRSTNRTFFLGLGLALAALVMAFAGPAWANAETDEDAGYFQAADLFNQKRWPEAQTAFQIFSKKYPASRWRSAVKLRLADLESDPKLALAGYTAVLNQSTDPEWKLLARWGMAQTYYTLGRYQEALDQYRQTGQIQGINQAKALTMSGLCLLALKQPKEARTCFEQAAAMTQLPNTAWTEQSMASIGDADMAAHDPAAALKSYSRYLQKYPEGDFADHASAGKSQAMKMLGKPDAPAKPEAKTTPVPAVTRNYSIKPATEPSLESRYTVQVGAFSKKEYAKKLETKLRRKGYKATIQEYAGANGVLHQVRIGAYTTKEAAMKAGQLLEKKEKLPYLILQVKTSQKN